jgi:GAF domain-containing protein
MNTHISKMIDQQTLLGRLLKISEGYEAIDVNFQTILKNIIKAICEYTGADCAALYPYDMNREEYYDKNNVATYGLNEPLVLTERPRNPESMANYIKREGEICIPDIIRDDPKMSESKFINREKVQAFMALAPKAYGQAVGLLYVNYRSPHTFTDEEKNIIRLFARQAGIAINNNWLVTRAKQQTDTIKELHNVGMNMVSIPTGQISLKELLNQIAKTAKLTLRADLVDLYHYKHEEDQFDIPPSQAGERSSPPIKVIYKDDVVYQLVREREPMFVKDAQSNTLFIRKFDDDRPAEAKTKERFVIREGVISSASIPLVSDEKVVGVLFVNYRTPQTFPDHQKELIHIFANQAAIAIANARLFENSLKRADALEQLTTTAEDMVGLSESAIDLDQLLQKIAMGAKNVLGANLVDLYQYYQSRDYYPIPIVMVGERYKQVVKDKIHSDDVVCDVVRRGRPWYVENTKPKAELHRTYDERKDAPAERFVDREKILSMAAIPMKTENEIVGVLFVSYRKRQLFTNSQKNLIELFAAQAAVAIRNARILIRRKAMMDFGEALTSSVTRLTEEEVIELIHDKASELMDTSNMYIALYDEISDTVRFPLAYFNGEKIDTLTDERWQPRKAGQGKTEEIIRTNLPIFNSTREEAEMWYAQPERAEYVGKVSPSWMGVPLEVGEKVIGVIATFHPDREYVYSKDDLLTLDTIANQAAVAIDNARMYYNVNTKLDAVVRFGESLTSESRLQETQVFSLVYEQVSQLMKADSMYIALYDSVFDMVSFGLAYLDGVKVDIEHEKGWQPRKAGKGKTEEIIQTKKPIFHPSKAEGEEWYAQPGRDEYIGAIPPSWMGVPMLLGNRVLGVIAVFDPEEEFLYTSDDLHVLQALANQTAIALDNARRYHYVSAKLTGLMEFGQKITESIYLSKHEILSYIHENVGEYLDTDNMYIALLDSLDGQEIIRFELSYRNGKREQWIPRPALAGRTGEIIKTLKPIFLPTREDVENWFKEHPGDKELSYSASWMGVPMMIGNRVLGVIGSDRPEGEQWFTEEDLDILQALANLAAIALENSRLYNEARDDLIAQRKLASMGSAMAAIEHRINNTLNIIVPNLNRLRKRVDTNNSEIQEILDIIDRNTRYTTQLLKRIQTPLQEVTRVDVDINAIVNEIFTSQRTEWAADSTHTLIDATLEVDERIPVLRLPEGQISEVILNLIQNAFRALNKAYQAKGQSGAKLQVSTALKDDKIFIRAQDNVPGGIAKAVQQRLFIKPVPSKTPGEGSGLGLWLSKLIMESIAGDICIESTGLLGTIMLIEIPVETGKEKNK